MAARATGERRGDGEAIESEARTVMAGEPYSVAGETHTLARGGGQLEATLPGCNGDDDFKAAVMKGTRGLSVPRGAVVFIFTDRVPSGLRLARSY